MLRMICYGNNNDPVDNQGMNALLNSSEIPDERCVSKAVAINNGTSESKMNLFEQANPTQLFPLNRLVPVWPIKESKVDTMCITPYDSRNVPLHAEYNTQADLIIEGTTIIHSGEKKCWSIDSYLAGYDYSVEIPAEANWLHYIRTPEMAVYDTTPWSNGYYYDHGIIFWADELPQGMSYRASYVIVKSTKNATYDDIYENRQGPNVCGTAKLFVRQGSSTVNNKIVEYVGTDDLRLGFGGAADSTNTHINTAVVYETTEMTGMFYANNKMYGIPEDKLPLYNTYNSFVTANGDKITIHFNRIKEYLDNPTGGSSTFYIYANWEGVGVSSNKIPVPERDHSMSLDITPNGNVALKTLLKVPISFGNMNIYDTGQHDPDSSSLRKKMCARCSCVAKVIHNWYTNKTELYRLEFLFDKAHTSDATVHDSTTFEYPGIRPVFYPTTYSAGSQSGNFSWTSAGVDDSSTQRTFSAVSVPVGSVVTVNVNSINYNFDEDIINSDGSMGNWVTSANPFNVSIGSGSAESSYSIGEPTITPPSQTTITTSQGVDISSGSFTIDLSGCDADTTHRFRLRQIISDSAVNIGDVDSDNASPEYADIAFTIVNQ